VRATPTFFINGKMYTGALSIEKMEELIDPLVKS
jgi:protein-disulfide isomerase